MGVFNRFRDIVNSNINSILDKAEDPEKMIRLMVQEMEDTLVDLKSSCASRMASRSEMVREKEKVAAMSARWDERAILAVAKGRDDLAKEALIEKKGIANKLEFLEKDVEHLDKLIAECRGNIQELESKLEEVSQKHKLLIQRGLHAQEKKVVKMTMRAASGAQAITRFGELENRIERMEAEADLYSTESGGRSDLENEFSRMEADSSINEELEALKKSVKGTKKSNDA